jgi:uncharacterized protein YqeY
MSVLEKLNAKNLELRKARDELAKSLSVVVSAANQIAKDRAEDKNNFSVTDDDIIQAIRRAIKQTEDTVSILVTNNAESGDLYIRSVREIGILKDLLPQSPDARTISEFVQSTLAETGVERNIKAMGPIMKALGEKYGSALDRSMASQIVRIELVED